MVAQPINQPAIPLRPRPWWPGLNGRHPFRKFVVGAWPLWEGAGILANDFSGNQLHATMHDGSGDVNWAGDVYGYSADFGTVGTTPKMRHEPVGPDRLGTRYTMLAVFRPATTSGDVQPIMANRVVLGSSILYQMDRVTNSTARMNVRDAAGNLAQASIAAILVVDQWHTIAGRRRGNVVDVSVDGTFSSTASASFGSITNAADAYLGNMQGGSQALRGFMAMGLLLDEAMSDRDIINWHLDPFAIFRPQRFVSPAIGFELIGPLRLFTAANWVTMNPRFEVSMRTTGGQAQARLFDVTASAVVAGSTLSTTSTTLVRLRSGTLTLVDGNEYRVQVGATGEILGAAVRWFP